jgi:hypothetical protein
MPRLTDDAYWLSIVDKNLRYDRVQLVRSACKWRYEGVLHEYLTCDNEQSRGRLPGLTYHRPGGGVRSQDPEKYLKDARVLKSALEREPNNARYAFYLAQSWRDAGCPHEALAAYRRRVEMGGRGLVFNVRSGPVAGEDGRRSRHRGRRVSARVRVSPHSG